METYRHAISLNPSESHLLVSSSSPLLYTGRFEEGLAVIDRALDLDPKHTGWFHWQRAWALWEQNRCEEAKESFERMAQLPTPAQRTLAAVHACLGNKEAAVAALKIFLDDNPGYTLATETKRLSARWLNQPSLKRWMRDMAFAGMKQ